MYKNILSEIQSEETAGYSKLNVNKIFLNRKVVIGILSFAAVFICAFFLGRHLSVVAGDNLPAKQENITYTEIKAPYGSKSEISLPDGSVVILNAGSNLKYSSDYNIVNRDLILSGEGYFKVARNNEIPLNVIAGNINIRAVGTEFNVKAYDDDEIIETTLIEGKVEITHAEQSEGNRFVDLEPNQKAIYIKEKESFTLEKISDFEPDLPIPSKTIFDNILISPKVDVKQVAAWTEGKLIIKGRNLEDLCLELQRKYNVTFVFGDEEIKRFRFTGILLDETLEQVLRAINLTAPVEYTLEGKTVYMKSDRAEVNHFSRHLK